MGRKITQSGDVVLGQNGDGVFTGRESYNSLHSMKFFTSVAATAGVVGTHCFAATPPKGQASQRCKFHDSGGFRSHCF